MEIGKIEKFVPAEAENPFIDVLAPILAAEDVIDTLVPVTFDADKYSAEKLQLQDAVRQLGYSARVHESDYDADSGRRKVRTVFRIRPARKPRTSAEAAEAEGDSAAE